MRAGREGEGDRCVYVPLVAPPPSLPTEAGTDAHDIDFGGGETENQTKETERGHAMAEEKGKWDVMV